MKIPEKLLPYNPLILAKTYNRIALTCVDSDDYDLALQYYNKALKIRQDNLTTVETSIASTYHNIGKLYHKQEDFTQAFKYYNHALDIYKTVVSPKHILHLKTK
jgi:tetratricopeptide (TPR) repeat protein